MTQASVVIPTYNRLYRLKQVLAGLERQCFPLHEFEVIVVSDGSTDGTHAYLQSFDTQLNLTIALQENQGPAAARNNGVARAKSDIIIFIDDDVEPTPQLLTEHMRIHDQAAHVAVIGPMLTPDHFSMAPWVRWEQLMLQKQYDAMQTVRWQPTARQFYTGNTSLPRQQIIAAGGFDTTLRRAEDIDLAYRLDQQGLGFIFNPNAIGYHYAERSFHSWLETPYAYGRNDVMFARDRHQDWLMPTMRHEFHRRNPLIRLVVRMCLGHSWLSRGTLAGLKLASDIGHYLHIDGSAALAYSAMFNLRYYQGVADELGGQKQFLTYMLRSYGELCTTDSIA